VGTHKKKEEKIMGRKQEEKIHREVQSIYRPSISSLGSEALLDKQCAREWYFLVSARKLRRLRVFVLVEVVVRVMDVNFAAVVVLAFSTAAALTVLGSLTMLR